VKSDLEALLRLYGPSLSTDLAAALVKRYRITSAAARKRISRPPPQVKRLGFLRFPRNARFLYLQADFGSERYWLNLIRALLHSNSAYGLGLAALHQRGGILPVGHFQIACGSPLRQKQHLSAETVLANLLQAKLVDKYEVPGVGFCVALLQGPDRYDEAKSDIRARLIVEKILLGATETWLKNLGIASYGKVAIRDTGPSQPKVGTFVWDLTAPCYLAPMLRREADGKQNPGFIACDVLLGTQVSEEGIRPFLNKCITLRSLRKVGRCMQIFIASHFAPAAFQLAKMKGVIPATPESLFGSFVAEGLTQLFDVLHDASRFAVDPAKFAMVFERLSQIEGAAINLRGALFEYLVAEILRRDAGGFVRMGRTFKLANGEKAEADILVEKQSVSVTFVECKGYQSFGTMSAGLMERWLTKSVPRIYEYARNHSEWNHLSIGFEFWTSGELSPEAQQLFTQAAAQVRATKYTLTLRDRDGLRESVEATKDSALIKVFDDHFFKHPLAMVEADAKQRYVRRPFSLANKEPKESAAGSIVPADPKLEPSDLPF
jgi:hypothetical protein